MTGSEAFAEDVTQDVSLALVREGGRFDPARCEGRRWVKEL
jgi:DNA-directed RNA polymerase specialized sigma24 family protein